MLPELSGLCVHDDATIDTYRAPAEQSLRRHIARNKSTYAPVVSVQPWPVRTLLVASCCGLVLTAMFAGLFGWSFSSWRNEIDAHNADLALSKLCTKLTLTDDPTAPLVFIDKKEYISFEHKEQLGSCHQYLLEQGVPYKYESNELTTKRKMSTATYGYSSCEGSWRGERLTRCKVNGLRYCVRISVCRRQNGQQIQ